MTFAPDPARIDAIRPGVGLCILNSAGQLLLHRRRACGRWAPPSGRMEVGETISEAAVREAAEETGLRVRIMQVIGVYSDPLFQVVPEAGGFTQYVTTCCDAEWTREPWPVRRRASRGDGSRWTHCQQR